MKKFVLWGFLSVSLLSLCACQESPADVGKKFARATFKCESEKTASECEKAKEFEQQIDNMSESDQLEAGSAALQEALELASEAIKNL